MRPRVALALALALPARVALAQGPQAPGPVFRAGLELVHVTVTVRDRQGRLVGDLRPRDFRVFEDGRPQLVQIFAPATDPAKREELALDVGLLMDTSESMIRELKLSQEAAMRFLEAIPRARNLLTVFFDQDIQISHYDSEQQQGLFDRILSTRGGGMTALYDAIAVCLSRIQDAPGRTVLLVFTDGEDSTSEVTRSELFRIVRSSAATIYPIAFNGQMDRGSSRALQASAVLRSLATLTGGQVFSPTSSRDLPAIYQAILDELGSQYVLGFVSDNPARDGRFRALKVEVRRRGLKVRHRAGYYAPLAP